MRLHEKKVSADISTKMHKIKGCELKQKNKTCHITGKSPVNEHAK